MDCNDGNGSHSVSFGVIERGGRIAKEGGELDDIVGIMELLLEEYSFIKLLLAQTRFKNNNVRNNSDANSFIMICPDFCKFGVFWEEKRFRISILYTSLRT